MGDPLSRAAEAAEMITVGIQACEELAAFYSRFNSNDEHIEHILYQAKRLRDLLLFLGDEIHNGPGAGPSFLERADAVIVYGKWFLELPSTVEKSTDIKIPTKPGQSLKDCENRQLLPFKMPTQRQRDVTLKDLVAKLQIALQTLESACGQDSKNNIPSKASTAEAATLAKPAPVLKKSVVQSFGSPPICSPRNTMFQRFPKPGASIGIQGRKDSTASLGGYIVIDDVCYGLTVDSLFPEDVQPSAAVVITHPSAQDTDLPTDAYPLGHLVARSGTRSRDKEGTQGRTGEMDWAVFKIDQWPFDLIQNLPYHSHPRRTSKIKPGAKVHATGRTSGYQRAIIESRLSTEWTLVKPKGMALSDWVSGGVGVDGDEGSWVIDSATGELYGVCWGRIGSPMAKLTLFTPIADILLDIKDIMGSKDIRLPSMLKDSPLPQQRQYKLAKSDISDLESVQSDGMSSQSPSANTGKTSLAETASVIILHALTRDVELQGLYKEGLTLLSQQKFIDNFQALLRRYCHELRLAATSFQELETTRWLRPKARSFAMQISYEFGDGVDDADRAFVRALIEHDLDKFQLDRYLAQGHARDRYNPATGSLNPNEEMKSEGSAGGKKKEVEFEHLKQMEAFLTAGAAFARLKKRLGDSIRQESRKEPNDHESPKIILSEEKTSEDIPVTLHKSSIPQLANPDPDPELELEELVEENEQEELPTIHLPSAVQPKYGTAPWYRRVWAEYATSVANELGSGLLHDLLRKSSRLPIVDGESRISWICACGHELYADIVCLNPGSSDRLMQDLVQGIGMEQLAAIPNVESTATTRRSQATSSSQANVLSSRRDPGPNSELSTSRKSSIATATSRADRQFVLLCVNYQTYDTRLAQIEVTQTANDQHLMQQVRQAYFSLRNCFNERLSLKHPRTIQLVKFELVAHSPPLPHQPVGIYEPPAVPSPDEASTKRYHYRPCPPQHSPPLPPNVFIHAFFNPRLVHTSKFLLTRIPKKLDARLECPDDPSISSFGWGVYIVDGPNWFLLSCVFLVILVSSGVLSLVWSIVQKDVSSGFTMGGYLVAVASAVLTVTFFWLNSPRSG